MKQDQFQIIPGIKNNYRVKGVLGHGAISEVLIGTIINEEEPFNEQQVAIKVLKNTTFIGNQVNKYFFQEKDIVHKLSTQRDDHIVNIIEVIEANDQYHIIMEFCENGSLLDQICLEIPNRLKVVVNFSTQLTRGVHFLHDHGIAHRDLKPENIFIHEKDGQYILKIGDYGLGKNEEIFMMHSCIGTINYMAPEMIRKEEYDFTVDIWALGCIMHELITGEQLFADYTIADISSQIKSMDEYKCIEGRFGFLISRCLQPKVQNRIRINDLYQELYCLYEDIASQRVEIPHKVIYKNYREQQQLQMQQQILQNNQQIVCQIYANTIECFNVNGIQNFGMDNLTDSLSINIQKDNLPQVGQILTPRSYIPYTPLTYNNFLHPNGFQNSFFKEDYINSIIQNKSQSNENTSQNNNISKRVGEGNNTCSIQIRSIEDINYQNNQQQQEQSVSQSQNSLDPKYIDLNRTQNYSFYQDKDTQSALRKKAQYNKKKGKTHKIKKNKEIMNSLNLKHTNSEIYLTLESPKSNKSINLSQENKYDPNLPQLQLQDFPNDNIILISPKSQSIAAQFPQKNQQEFYDQTLQLQNLQHEQMKQQQSIIQFPFYQQLQQQQQIQQQQQQYQQQNHQKIQKQLKFRKPLQIQQFQPSLFQKYQQQQKLDELEENLQFQNQMIDQVQQSQCQQVQEQQQQPLNQHQVEQFEQKLIQQLQLPQQLQQPDLQHFQQSQLLLQPEMNQIQQNEQFQEQQKQNLQYFQQIQQQPKQIQNYQQIQNEQQMIHPQQVQLNQQTDQNKQIQYQQNQQFQYHLVIKEPYQVQYKDQNKEQQFVNENQQDLDYKNNNIQLQHQQLYEQPQKQIQQIINEQIYQNHFQQQQNIKHQNIYDIIYHPQNQQHQHLKQQQQFINNNNKQQYFNNIQQNYHERQYQNIPDNYNLQQLQQLPAQQIFIPQQDFQYNNQRCNETYFLGYTDTY